MKKKVIAQRLVARSTVEHSRGKNLLGLRGDATMTRVNSRVSAQTRIESERKRGEERLVGRFVQCTAVEAGELRCELNFSALLRLAPCLHWRTRARGSHWRYTRRRRIREITLRSFRSEWETCKPWLRCSTYGVHTDGCVTPADSTSMSRRAYECQSESSASE